MLVNGRIVEKEVVKLSEMDSHTACQVEIVPSRIKEIVEGFNPIELGVLTVVKLGSRFIIIDGQHRRASLLKLGIKNAECWVYYNVPESDFGNLFYEVNMRKHGCERHEQYSGTKTVTKEIVIEKLIDDNRTTRIETLNGKCTDAKCYLASNACIFEMVKHQTRTTYNVVGEVPSHLSNIFKIIDGVVFVDKLEFLKWFDKNKDKIKKCCNRSNEIKIDEENARKIELLEDESKRAAKAQAEAQTAKRDIDKRYIAITNSSVNSKMGGNWTDVPEKEEDKLVNENWKMLYKAYDSHLKINSGKEYLIYKNNVAMISKKEWICSVRHEGKLLFDLACELSYKDKLYNVNTNIRSREDIEFEEELFA